MIKVSSVKVSILLPAFNAERTLHTCLESIMAQIVPDDEDIAVNDYPTDNLAIFMPAHKDQNT